MIIISILNFTHLFFYIKDINTKVVFLSGQSKDGLYVLLESSAMSIPHTYRSLCVSASIYI